MIVDAFLYGGEKDLLNLRLDTLNGVVDVELAVVGSHYHGSGEPTSFDEEEEGSPIRFIHADLSSCTTAWSRENRQREALWEGIKGFSDDTLILLSDVDEIPNPEAVEQASKVYGPRTFSMRGHYLCIDWLHPEAWLGTVAARRGQIKTLNELRRQRHNYPIYRNAGWHFSWLGGPSEVEAKFNRWCHSELPTDLYDVRNGYHVDGVKMLGLVVDDSYPKWIHENAPASWYRSYYAESPAQQVS